MRREEHSESASGTFFESQDNDFFEIYSDGFILNRKGRPDTVSVRTKMNDASLGVM